MMDFCFTWCGICALASRLRHIDLMDTNCKTDYIIAEKKGVHLYRYTTLDSGDDSCHYIYFRPGSEAERRWTEEHKDEERELK